MSTLKKLTLNKKIRIKNTALGAEHLDAILAKFAEGEGSALAFFPLTKEMEEKAESFFGEALPDGFDRYLIVCEDGVTVYFTNEISKIYALYEILRNYDGGIGGGMIYGRAYMQMRGYKTYLPPKDDIAGYKRVMDMLLYLGYNTLTIELVGAAEYKSHPEINEGWEELCAIFAQRNGFTRDIARSFIYPKNSIHVESGGGKVLSVEELCEIRDYAYARGLEIIPEMPCLSHSDYLLYKHPEFAEVPEDHYPDVCCPSNPDYYKMLFEIFDDMIEIFKPKRINVGHDELYVLGRCPRCQGKRAADLLAGDLTKIRDFLASRGVKTMLWGDKVSKAWHGGNPAFHVRLPQENGRTVTFKEKTYPWRGFMCKSVPEFLEYVKEHPSTEAWFVEETASCLENLPSDLEISSWSYYEGEMHEDTHAAKGFCTLFGNCAPNGFRDVRRRTTKKGSLGFSVSNWGNVDPISAQREGHLFHLFFGAHVAWDKDYNEGNKEPLYRKVAEEMFALFNKEALAAPHILVDHTCDFAIDHYSFDCGFRVIREDFYIGDYEITYKNGEKSLYPVVWGENIGPAIKDMEKLRTALSDRAVSFEPIGTALPLIGKDTFAYRIAIPVSGEVEGIRFVKNEKCAGEVAFTAHL